MRREKEKIGPPPISSVKREEILSITSRKGGRRMNQLALRGGKEKGESSFPDLKTRLNFLWDYLITRTAEERKREKKS